MIKKIIPILVIMVLVIFGSGCTSSESEDSTVPNETHAEAKNVVILNSKGNSTGMGNYLIKGEVKNNNKFGVAFVKVNATGYDEKNNIVSESYTYINDNDLDPGAQSKFELFLDDTNNKIVKYDISILDADKSLYKYNLSSSESSSKFPLVLPDGMKVSCPSCGSYNNIVTGEEYTNGKYWDSFKCKDCSYTWDEPFSNPVEGTPVNG